MTLSRHKGNRAEVGSLRKRGWGTLLASVGGVMLLASCGGGTGPGVIVRPASSTPVPGSGQPAADDQLRPTETASPGQVVTTVDELVRRFGWPAGANFARIRIPTIGVDARVGARVVATDGVMPDPSGPADVVWYDMSGWPGMGGLPGSGGNAIFSGHVDYDYVVPYANVRYRGKGVFAGLNDLRRGDMIEVERGGEKLRYSVIWQRQVAASSADWAEIWTSVGGKDSVTLYTCAGRFDANLFEYADRLVVRAERS
jgi:hypothetical protein